MGASQNKCEDPQKRNIAIATLVGSFLILSGYYLPWYSIAFEPPGGYAWLNGLKYYAYTYGFSGLNVSQTTTTTLLQPLILTTFLLGLFDLIRLLLPSKTANTVIHQIGSFFHSDITGTIKDSLQALAHILVALAWVAFLLLYLAMLKWGIRGLFANSLGGGVDAMNASHYVSIHFGIGMIFMFLGLLVGGIALFRKAAIAAVLLGVLTLVLACTHSPYLGTVLHYLGY